MYLCWNPSPAQFTFAGALGVLENAELLDLPILIEHTMQVRLCSLLAYHPNKQLSVWGGSCLLTWLREDYHAHTLSGRERTVENEERK